MPYLTNTSDRVPGAALMALAVSACLAVVPLATAATLTGSEDLGNLGRHMVGSSQSLGTITLTGGPDIAGGEAGTLRANANGYALHGNGLLLRSATDFDFVNMGSEHSLDIYMFDAGPYAITNFTLPAANTYHDADDAPQVSYGGHWFYEGKYNTVLGESQTRTVNDLTPSPLNLRSPLGGLTTGVDGRTAFNRVEAAKPAVITSFSAADSPTQFQLIDEGVDVFNRRTPLLTSLPADSEAPAPGMDLSDVSITASGTALLDRDLSGNTIDLGRQMIGASGTTATFSSTDTAQVSSFTSDDIATRVRLGAFDKTQEDTQGTVTAKLMQGHDFTGPGSATVNVTAGFTVPLDVAGTHHKTVDLSDAISSLEKDGNGLAGETLDDNLSVGYQWAVVDNNTITSEDVTVLVRQGASLNGPFTNDTVGLKHSTSTHTAIGVDQDFTLDTPASTDPAAGLAPNKTVTLNKANGGVAPEGLTGEAVAATTSYGVYTRFIAPAQLQASDSSQALSANDQITFENQDAGADGVQADLSLYDVERTGSTRWSVSALALRAAPGATATMNVVFDDTGVADPEDGELGRDFRTTVAFKFEDAVDHEDPSVVGANTGGAARRVARIATAGPGASALWGVEDSRQTKTYTLEHNVAVQAASGSATFAVGTNLRDEGANLTFNDRTFAEPTTAKLLDSETLGEETPIDLAFTLIADLGTNEAAAAEGVDFVSDVLSVTGLDETLHTIELSFDLDEQAVDSALRQLLWYDADQGTVGAWSNAVLGNSDVVSYDVDEDEVNLAGTGTTSLSSYLADRQHTTSYVQYLESQNLTPTLGDFGVDSDARTVWAVIDHNSDFAVAVSPVPEPGIMVLAGVGLGVLALRCGRGKDGEEHNAVVETT